MRLLSFLRSEEFSIGRVVCLIAGMLCFALMFLPDNFWVRIGIGALWLILLPASGWPIGAAIVRALMML